MFNEIFQNDTSFPTLFKKVMIPILKTAVKDYKDASLVLFGGRGSGKTKLIGSYSTFYLHENLLASTLAFIFEQVSKKPEQMYF